MSTDFEALRRAATQAGMAAFERGASRAVPESYGFATDERAYWLEGYDNAEELAAQDAETPEAKAKRAGTLAMLNSPEESLHKPKRNPHAKPKEEPRYLVLKLSDVHAALNEHDAKRLNAILQKVQDIRRRRGAEPTMKCLVVEADWPEYAPTYDAILRRTALGGGQKS